MKNKLLFLLLISMCFSGYAQVQIGSNVNNTSANFPFRTIASYSYSQSIYLASEINASGTITSIQWYYSGTSPLTYSQDLDIYIGNTAKTAFASDTDMEPVANLTKVYTGGIITNSTPGWKTITLTTPFVYNGTSNLVVAVDENTYDQESAGNYFYTTEVSGLRSLTYYGASTTNVDPANPYATGNNKIPRAAFVPNIIFGGITQSCATPVNIVVSNITSSSASLTWNDTATHTQGCEYYLSTTKTPPTASTQATGTATTSESIAVTGLSPITTYYVWVRNNCGNGTYSAWSEMTTFFSGCGTYATLIENFDTTATSSMPLCWKNILRVGVNGIGTGSFSNGSVRAINQNSYSGVNSLLIYNGSTPSGSYDVIAVSPELTNLSAGTQRIQFYAKCTSGTGVLQFGTLDNNTSSGVFTALPGQSITVTNAYVKYTVDLTGYTGLDKFFGIRHASSGSAQIFIDDIRYDFSPACPDVTNVVVKAVTDSSVTVTWNGSGAEAKWDVAVGAATVTDPSTLAFDTTTDPAHTFTKTGLTPGTNYNVWVRSVCPNGNKGLYYAAPFVSLCTNSTVLNENFDSATVPALPACWSKILRGTTTGAKVETTTASSVSTPNSAILFNENSTGTYDVILVSAPLANLGASTHRVRFTVSGLASPQLQIGTLDSNLNLSTTTFTPLPSQPLINVTNSKVEYIVNFDSYAGGTNLFIGFKLISASSYKTIYIDNVVWEQKPLCADVKNIVVAGVSTNSAGFTWDVQGTEHLWDVAVGPATTTDPNVLTPVTTDLDVNAAEITNLQPATAYKVWVRAHCVDSYGKYIGPVVFNTDCNAGTTFSEDFNSYVSSSNLPPCWNKIIRNAAAASGINIEKNLQTQSVGITVYGDNSNTAADIILVCPMVSTIKDPNYRLNINVSGSNSIEVGTVNNLSSTATFTKITEFKPNGITYIGLSSYTGNDQYIALRLKTISQGTSQYFSVDDIKFELAPVCPNVSNVAVSSVTSSNATVTWTAGGAETKWDIAVGEQSVTDPSTLPFDTTSDTGHSFNKTGLNAGTKYLAWVRSHCDNGNGIWVGPVYFSTDCNIVASFNEDFNAYSDSNNLPVCWNKIIRNADPVSVIAIQNKGITVNGATSDTNADVILVCPIVSTLNNSNYRLNLNASGSNAIEVGTVNNLSSAAIFTKITEFMPNGASSIDLSSYIGTDQYIALRLKTASASSNQYFSVDNVSWSIALGTDEFDMSKFTYYPNPVKDVLNLSYDTAITSVSIYNVIGQNVLSKSINDSKVAVNLSELNSGTYFIKVTAGNQIKTLKIVKD